MSAPMSSRRAYAVEDCEQLLANHRFERPTNDIKVNVELFAELVSLARRARAWGA